MGYNIRETQTIPYNTENPKTQKWYNPENKHVNENSKTLKPIIQMCKPKTICGEDLIFIYKTTKKNYFSQNYMSNNY